MNKTILAVIGIGAGVLACWTVVYGVTSCDELKCSVLGLEPKAAVPILVLLSISGWIVVLSPIFRSLLDSYFGRDLKEVSIIADDVMREVVNAKVVRIFSSGSQASRAALHSRVASITQQMEVRVLVRTDGTKEREAQIKRDFVRWNNDINKANVRVQIRKYAFDPVMFRGWILDNNVAVVGWYYRKEGATTGQGDPGYRISNAKMVAGLRDLFDQMFEAGQKV